MLQFGTQKVLKCWAGYDIITAEDIPADITAVIDREGRLWLAPGCRWRLYRGGADHHPAKGGRCPVIFPDLRALDTHIKAGALLPVYLLYGEENRQIESGTGPAGENHRTGGDGVACCAATAAAAR